MEFSFYVPGRNDLSRIEETVTVIMRRAKSENKRSAAAELRRFPVCAEKGRECIAALLDGHHGVAVQAVNAQKSVAGTDKRRGIGIDGTEFGLDPADEKIVEAGLGLVFKQGHIYPVFAYESFDYRF